ncbi:MAG: hypothetical protein ACRDYZ_00750 [Acidimicrobiales bacterium]
MTPTVSPWSCARWLIAGAGEDDARSLLILAADRLDDLNVDGEAGTIQLAADLRRLAGAPGGSR